MLAGDIIRIRLSLVTVLRTLPKMLRLKHPDCCLKVRTGGNMPQTFAVNQVRLMLLFLIAAFQVLDTEDANKSIRGTWINFGYGILSQQIIQPSYDSNLLSQVTFISASIFIIGISTMVTQATFAAFRSNEGSTREHR